MTKHWVTSHTSAVRSYKRKLYAMFGVHIKEKLRNVPYYVVEPNFRYVNHKVGPSGQKNRIY